MTKIIKKTSMVLLTSLLVISNMISRCESFANENNILEASTFTVKKQENPDCKPEKVTNLRITDKSTTCLKLEWDKVYGATGYNIYRTTLKNGIYLKVGQVCKDTTYFVDKDLNSGKNYFYKVKAYTKIGDKKYSGCPSDILYATTCPEQVESLRADCISNCSIQISWATVCGASGYEVYRSTCKNGNYTRVATKLDGKQNFYIDNGLKSCKKYYYKVRAFRELNGKITFGKCSDVLETRTK